MKGHVLPRARTSGPGGPGAGPGGPGSSSTVYLRPEMPALPGTLSHQECACVVRPFQLQGLQAPSLDRASHVAGASPEVAVAAGWPWLALPGPGGASRSTGYHTRKRIISLHSSRTRPSSPHPSCSPLDAAMGLASKEKLINSTTCMSAPHRPRLDCLHFFLDVCEAPQVASQKAQKIRLPFFV